MSTIIDIISQAAPNKRNMSAADFFTDNNPNGYCSKAGFVTFLQNVGENNLKRIDLVHEYLNDGYRNDNPPIAYNDNKTSYNCVYCTFNLAGSSQNIKYMVIERTANFIKDCQQGKIKPAFTLTDLYTEAVKTEN